MGFIVGFMNVMLALFCGTVIAFVVWLLWESCEELRKISRWLPFAAWTLLVALYVWISIVLLQYANYTGWTP